MESKTLILKIADDKIWYNNTGFIPFEQTDIPYEFISFKTHRDIYWLVEMTNSDRELGKLWISVINYDCTEQLKFLNQQPKYEVKYLVFGKFDWTGLEPHLFYYQKNKFINQLFGIEEDPYARYKDQVAKDMEHLKSLNFVEYGDDFKAAKRNAINSISPSDFPYKPIVKEFTEEFIIDFKNCKFQLGYVECTVKSMVLNRQVDLKVFNSFMLSQFDTIKSWFSKKLGKKKIKVIAYVICVDNEIMECNSTSEDIELINEEFIESLKILRTQQLSKTLKPSANTAVLFTSEDIFNLISNEEGNVFQQDEKEIIDILKNGSSVRNRAELDYLSTNKQSIKHKIRFTTRPLFGFMFTVEGTQSIHFIWELLESHATYIWTINCSENSDPMLYKRIEMEIERIFDIGREEYKRAYKDAGINTDFTFNAIQHKAQSTPLEYDYSKWVQSINELLL